MSSYVNSLLVELGIRAAPHHPDEAEHSRGDESTKLPNNNDPVHSPDQDRIVSDLPAGNAGSLHGPSPPFFTPLLKDMDRRTSERGRQHQHQHQHPRHDGEFSSQDQSTPVITTNNIIDNPHHIDMSVPSLGNMPLQEDESGAGQNERSIGGDAQSRRGSQEGSGQNSGNTLNADVLAPTSLPADDGMGWLRKKIIAIRDRDLDNNEKARMVHDLMTEKYNRWSHATMLKSPTLSNSPMHHLPSSPLLAMNLSPDPCHTTPSPTSDMPAPPYENHFSLTAEDLQPTYVPRVEPDSPAVETGDEAGDEAGDQDTEELDEASLGCQHYKRNVKLQCFTCKKWYTCRFCHDEVEDHPLVRRDTENMLCMLCGHAQPAAQNCHQCGEDTAHYYCDICKLWDNDSKKSIYHCHDCGICRIGQGLGKDFFHCKTCCVCLPISIEDTHRCIERSTQCDCPICGDYMFTSPETVVVMRCGHSLHHKCLSEHSKTSFRCPICSKTITNMESTFRNLDRTIESQPMPAEFTDTKGLVYCNDCGAKSIVKYHWLGLKCDLCESYNTAQIRILQGDVSAVLEEEGVNESEPQPQPEPEPNEPPLPAAISIIAALHMNNTPPSQSRLSVPGSAGSDNRFVSYNMTHNRAISPVVSNYFGLPTERESEKPSSLPFFGSPLRSEGDTDYGALNFLSKKLRDRYGFLSNDAATVERKGGAGGEGEGDEEDDDDEAESSSSSSGSDNENDDDDDDDGIDPIDLLGHR
ncbi:hypothetical protein N7481_002796 [Penicillium waksmanii]|uniref:uncharacterized protein n=1 Tax=Penicillium waksmanii TaxID=69791 RepID=UPI00254927D3|nr:uncharacterized protein N7481_002796 [Penicillium waksmanii]KAJ5995819.1 hypothetical protein N7481_002796 [Penicillium waksmanii]